MSAQWVNMCHISGVSVNNDIHSLIYTSVHVIIVFPLTRDVFTE